MYTFPKEMRAALESCEASFVYYQRIGDEAVHHRQRQTQQIQVCIQKTIFS